MKLKDLELPCFVKMRDQAYGNPYRYATEVVVVESWRSYRKATKKVAVQHCKPSGDGTTMVIEDWVDKVLPGQLLDSYSEAEVLERLGNNKKREQHRLQVKATVNAARPLLAAALKAAGFPEPCAGWNRYRGDTLEIADHQIFAWAEQQGIAPTTSEED